jgi:Flp pilus assembly pilin Flp
MRFIWPAVRGLQSEDRGQDLAEYCLLTALVALVALGIVVQLSGGIKAVWYGAYTSLTAGNAATSSQPAAASTPAVVPNH